MKFSEVIKALEENTSKKFEFNDSENRFEISVTNNGYFMFAKFLNNGRFISRLEGGDFSGNARVRDDWQEVKQPVTPAKAFEAWIAGRSVYYVDDSGYKQCIDDFTFKSGGCNVTKRSVKVYTWYVEE